MHNNPSIEDERPEPRPKRNFMNWNAAIRTACLCLLTLGGLYTYWDLHQMQASLRASIAPLGPAASKGVTQIVDAISGPRGTLHEANKAIVAVKDAVITTQIQERAIAPHTIAAVDSLASIAPHANSAMDSVAKTADAGADSARQLTATLAMTGKTVESLQGPINAFQQDAADLDALLKSHALNQTLDNVASMTGSGAGILANGDRVTKKMADDYLKPSTPWGKFWHVGLDVFDVAAAAARHAP
jgi:hypothetical protein